MIRFDLRHVIELTQVNNILPSFPSSFRFRLVSLNRLSDTKSSLNKGTTLLHYLVDLLEKKFKDILKLEEDLSFVREASKVR